MSSAILQSNSQPALISTLNATSSASIDPFIYSLNKRVPAHGVSWMQLAPVSPANKNASQTMSFDLVKSGFTRTLTLSVRVAWPEWAGATNSCYGFTGGAFLNLIDHITIESSSRRLATMTKASMMLPCQTWMTDQGSLCNAGGVVHMTLHLDQ